MRPLMIAAALALLASAPAKAGPADGPQKAPAPKAACHAGAKPGKAASCGKRPPKTRIATPMITRCRDVISHRPAKCGGPNAEPVPAN